MQTRRVIRSARSPHLEFLLGIVLVSYLYPKFLETELIQCFTGNIIGPQVFRAQDAPAYTLGWTVTVVTSIVAAVLALLYRCLCMVENKQRDKAGIMEGFDDAFNDDLTDKKVRFTMLVAVKSAANKIFNTQLTSSLQNPQFRYIL